MPNSGLLGEIKEKPRLAAGLPKSKSFFLCQPRPDKCAVRVKNVSGTAANHFNKGSGGLFSIRPVKIDGKFVFIIKGSGRAGS